MVEPVLPTLTTVILTGLVDSINPCAIGVMILLLSTLMAMKQQQEMLKVGLIYISAVSITYFAYGLGLTALVASTPLKVAEYISIVVALVIIAMGLVEVKDFFWYGKGFSLHINPKHAHMIKERMKKLSIWTAVVLGIFVASVELPCTGGAYLAITVILAQSFNATALLMLVLYNIIFVLPLIIILFSVLGGSKIQDILRWKQGNKALMRYFGGLLMIGLGWLLMLIANGTINLS